MRLELEPGYFALYKIKISRRYTIQTARDYILLLLIQMVPGLRQRHHPPFGTFCSIPLTRLLTPLKTDPAACPPAAMVELSVPLVLDPVVES